MNHTITLPFPISANRYWRSYRGRVVVSAEATTYKTAVRWCCIEQGVQEPLTGDVALTLDFYRPTKRVDLDNMQKILLDAIQGFAYLDDKQIIEIHARRFDDRANPRVEVCVSEVQ